MPFESDFFYYSDAEKADPAFFAPLLQPADAPSPESFNKDIDNQGLDIDWSFDELEVFRSSFRDTIPAVSIPSGLTFSTQSGYGSLDESSQYFDNFAPSVYSNSSEIETRVSENDGLCSMENFGFSAAFCNNVVGISPDDLSTKVSAVQQSAVCVAPSALPVRVMPDSEEVKMKTAPTKPFECPQCLFSSARKYNLKKHVDEKHNGLKPFGCGTCGHQFTRKHDLRRHRATMHGDWTSTASVSTLSSRHFGPEPDLPQHQATINGDQRLTMSAYPDSSSSLHPATGATAVPVDITAWYRECEAFLQEV